VSERTGGGVGGFVSANFHTIALAWTVRGTKGQIASGSPVLRPRWDTLYIPARDLGSQL
jgi:hypothetical protein